MIRKLSFVYSALFSIGLGAQVPPSEDMCLYDISVATSAQRIARDVGTLVAFDTRHSLSDTRSDTSGIGAAWRWIQAEF